jgi:hypothetical protein
MVVLCRSLRQLKKEVATKLAKAAAVKVKADNLAAAPTPVPAGLYDYESQSDTGMSPGPFTESHQEYIKVLPRLSSPSCQLLCLRFRNAAACS